MAADHYATLGVPPTARIQEIRAAYLRAMRACHPDLRPGDLAAGEAARRANLAWQVLGDPERRAAYDRQMRARGALTVPAPPADPGQAAYLARRRAYGRAFHQACLKGAAAVFALGVVLLAFSAG